MLTRTTFGVLLFSSMALAAPAVTILGPSTAAVGDEVLLESQILDPGEGRLAYSWYQVSGTQVTLTGTDQRNLTFIVPAGAAGSRLVIGLIVSDPSSSSQPATLSISVPGNPSPNHEPVAVPGDAVTMVSGASVTLDGTKSRDPDGEQLTYSWQQIAGPTAVLTAADTPKVTIKAPKVTQPQVLGIRLTVTDPRGAIGSAAVGVTVQPAGCGCEATEGSWLALAGLSLLALRHRRLSPNRAPLAGSGPTPP